MDTAEERKQAHEEIEGEVVDSFDMNNLPEVKHRWVDRGLIMSCEDAGHPNHRHFKRLERK